MTTLDTTKLTVAMPSLGENVTEGTVTRWLKQPGDSVNVDEPLLEVATDKVDTEIPSPAAGVLSEIIANEDDVVEIGAPLAIISPAGEHSAVVTHTPVTPGPVIAPPAAEPAVAPLGPPMNAAPARSIAINSPSTEKLSVPTDVEPVTPEPAAQLTAQPKPARSEGDRVEKLSRIRRTIAARMVDSLQTSAQLTTVVEVDISAIASLRRDHKQSFLHRTGHKLSYLPFFVKAAVESLENNPVVNSSLDPDVTTVTYHRACHLGMAVDSEKGLMVPVIRDAQSLTISGLAQAITSAAERVRSGTIGADELSGGTFTVTNTGSRGALFDTPIINQPQSAILGTGAVVERLVPRYHDGNLSIAVAPMVYLSISYDHRIVDGADAARFLGSVKSRLEHGYSAADLL